MNPEPRHTPPRPDPCQTARFGLRDSLFPVWLALVLLTFVLPSKAQVLYSGIQDIDIPLDFNGLYLNPYTGVTTTAYPGDWNVAPWINPFFGGVGVANDALMRPVITGADQVVNLSPGTYIFVTSIFAAGESGSSTHMGAAPDQFQLGTPGYIGFTFQPTVGGDVHYGWASVTFKNTGPGTLHSWAWEQTANVGIKAGAVPEPGGMTLLLLGASGVVLRRRRRPGC